MIPRLALGALTLLAALFTSVGAQAAELLMFDDPGCVWCRRWNAEIAPSYPKTREGQQAPLRRVPIRDQARAGVALARPINATPTFVLVEDGQEVGRIDGYAGKDFFYPMLASLLRRLAPTQRLGPPLPRSASCAAAACQPPMPSHTIARQGSCACAQSALENSIVSIVMALDCWPAGVSHKLARRSALLTPAVPRRPSPHELAGCTSAPFGCSTPRRVARAAG